MSLILGTMNIIGDSTNPIEFSPSPMDVAAAPGGAQAFAEEQVAAAAAIQIVTVGAVKAKCTGTEAGTRLDAFLASKGIADAADIVTLCKTKVVDLGLDNKWVDGRLNPIVFALSPMPGDASVTQMEQVKADSAGFFDAVVAYYSREWVGAAAKLSDSVAALLLWDLLCTSAVAASPDTFTNLAKASYLVQGDGSPTPRDELLRTLFAPLRNVIEENADVPLIVGCQEMPRAEGPLEAALPANCSVYRQPTPEGNITGFVYSTSLAAGFADVSPEMRPEMTAWLEQNGIDAKVIDTTVRKMCIGQFTVGKGKVIVIVTHCKSFKAKAEKQGLFIAHALRIAQLKFGCPAYCVGDMNIEGQWAKGTTAVAQAAAIGDADLGMLPELVGANSHVFGGALKTSGYTAYPDAGTITTLKMRTQFQGQPDKEGSITAVHKDYVILPADTSADVIIGGLPEDGSWNNNMQLLQPSRSWPADHFAIFCVLD